MAKSATWLFKGMDHHGHMAVVHLRRSEPPISLPFDQIAPQFSRSFSEFAKGESVKRYRNARENLLKAIEEASDAATGVIESESRLIEAATLEAGELRKADDDHEKAVAKHSRSKKRVTLLREACEHAWSELNREYQALGDKMTKDVFAETTAAIRAKEAELAQLAGPILDEIGQLMNLRNRGGASRPWNIIALHLEPPPQADASQLEPERLLSGAF